MRYTGTSPLVLALLLTAASSVLGKNTKIGQTPQMGWNTWNKFACGINEELIRRSADKIVDLGLAKLGYNYVNIDDCWNLKERDANGHIQADPAAFPSGMKAMGDYIHGKGLKFGIYSSAGTLTCEERAASLYNEQIDANDFAAWGVDYLKYDNCFNQGVPAIERYTRMHDALMNTGRDIFYSICNWGMEYTYQWAPKIGNSWRTTMDIKDLWASIEYNFKQNDLVHASAGPSGWNDPDMLEVGNGGLTEEQERTHFALWAVAKAPLILGCDLDNISQASFEIITN
jgi:alpha-galactosidase